MPTKHSKRKHKKKTPLPLPADFEDWAYEQSGKNPLAWRYSAENLLTAARAVRKEVKDFGGMMYSLAAVEAMLLGFAIECLLKAIYIKGGNTLVKQGRYAHIPHAADHDLIPSCAKTRPIGLRGLAVVELEHAAQPLTAHDRACAGQRFLGRIAASRSCPRRRRKWIGAPSGRSGSAAGRGPYPAS